eukprot:SAG31_NODE_24187_length_487_cov_0.801546_1_plen_89_part_01
MLMLILGVLWLLQPEASIASTALRDTTLYKCKDAASDWPLPCQPPARDIQNYKFAGTFPIAAWWGPKGYSAADTSEEYKKYVEARFNMV